jgi:bifunctional UDP-N-acetylglucosamine pyrophosphorylase/glucosamine-1-phosphate N-acetyltransferase
MSESAVLILAAGKGTRLKSQLPKVLHEAGGRPLIEHTIRGALAAGIGSDDIYVVAGFGVERVRDRVAALHVQVLTQEPQLGSGHAVQIAEAELAGYETILVLNGDMPLLSASTIGGLLQTQQRERADAALATAEPAIPRAYGRIVRDGRRIVRIVEHRQANAEQKRIRELNAGFYCFKRQPLFKALRQVGTDNPHGEYYLTDVVGIMAAAGRVIVGYPLSDHDEILGVNDRAELAQVDRLLRDRKLRQLMEAGVTVYAPGTLTVDADVEVGADTIVEPGVQLLGATRVGSGCRIRSYSIIENCEIANGVLVRPHCYLVGAKVEQGAEIGPYSRLREGAHIGPGAHIGNFVEVKKTRIGRGTKAMHLAYLGDAEIGAGANIGAGTITCNYDGVKKHQTKVGDGTFVGSNSTLVAPLEVGAGAYIAAGSVITDPVPEKTLALGRARQTNKTGWVEKRSQEQKNKAG